MVTLSTLDIIRNVVSEVVIVMGSKRDPDVFSCDAVFLIKCFFQFAEVMRDPAKAGKVWHVCMNEPPMFGQLRRNALYRLFWKAIHHVRFDGQILSSTFGGCFDRADRMLPVHLFRLCACLLSRMTPTTAFGVLFPNVGDRERFLLDLLSSETSLREDRSYATYMLEMLHALWLAGTDFSHARDLPVCTAAHVLRSIRNHYKNVPSLTLQFVLSARDHTRRLPDEALTTIKQACSCASLLDGFEDEDLLYWFRHHAAEAEFSTVLSLLNSPKQEEKMKGACVLDKTLDFIRCDLDQCPALVMRRVLDTITGGERTGNEYDVGEGKRQQLDMIRMYVDFYVDVKHT